MRRLRALLTFCILTLSVFGQSAGQELMKYAGNIHQFSQIFPQEKVYVQFDNTSYYTGETIWFKAFVTEASTLHRAPSKVLYVELLSPTGVILKRQKLKIVAGQADGSFPLYDGSVPYARDLRGVLSYPSGFYEVRAYTTNMQNFQEEAIFSRVLPVFEEPQQNGNFYGEKPVIKKQYNKDEHVEQFRPKTEKENQVGVSFFPEGGSLMAGLENRVAFKVTGSDGLGMEAEGFLNDSIPVRTVHDGMGMMIFTPSTSGNTLRLSIEGRERTFRLPDVSSRGFLMNADIVRSRLKVRVSNIGMSGFSTLGLTLTCRGELYSFKELNISEGYATEDIPLIDVPEGVCQLTLFDENGAIYSRRTIYHKTEGSRPQLSFTSNADEAGPFTPIHISLTLKTSAGRALRDRFCLSVRDSRCPGTVVHDDLRTSMLLSSDIRGYVHRPEYYFESDDSMHTEALDLLMMVQGWERYDWETMAGIKPYREIHRMEDSISVNGWVETPGSRKPMDSIIVTAAAATPDRQLVERFRYVTGEDGYFGFNLSDFQDYADFTISAWPRRKRLIGTSARIRFERSIKPTVRAYAPQETLLTDASGNIADNRRRKNRDEEEEEELHFPEIIDMNDGYLLPDVDIKEKRMYVDYYTFKAFNVTQDTELELDLGDYTTNVSGYLIDKGYDVEFDDSGNVASINGHTPYFYVHETEKALRTGMFESPGLLDVKDIRSIMVFDDVMYETEAMKLSPLLQEYRRKHLDYDTPETLLEKEHNRVLLVDIYVKDEAQRATRRELKNINSRKTTVEGFSQAYQFYSPEYPDGPVYGDVDYRRTLYWNPNVVTDNSGHAEVSFYNNSSTSSFRINAAGITASGTPYVLDEKF